jgi:predicted nucleic-acid-binding protein
MNVAVDTNVLARAVLWDDKRQARAAAKLLRNAVLVAVPLPCLCELVWILKRGARLGDGDIVRAIEALVAAENVAVNRPAVEAGLAMFRAGGDFADGIMAHEGQWLGGETFVSFDREAVRLLAEQGQKAKLLR